MSGHDRDGKGRARQNDDPDTFARLLARHPRDPREAMEWLAEVWQYFLDSGLHIAGGPADAASADRLRLTEKIQTVAVEIGDQEVTAEANRITAHALNASERYQEAVPYYAEAIAGLEALGQMGAAASTRLGYASVLHMTGAHQQALAACHAADQWFIETGDDHAHARVLINTGNAWHRVDEHTKALECHLAAAEIFEQCGQAQDRAIASLNIANSYTFLDQFEQSDAMYQQAEEIATATEMSGLADQARYNRAYLFFLRGRYSDAITSFNRLRQQFVLSDSPRHAALCDLDQTEIYLQLNLPDDAAPLAIEASRAFADLGMSYEQAKATTFLGVAETQRHHYTEALVLFEEAGSMFIASGNAFWIGMVELYRAEVLLALGRYWEARFRGEDALKRFEALDMVYQRGMALIVLSRVAIATNRVEDLRHLSETLSWLTEGNRVPLLDFPAHALCGQIAEQGGQRQQALQHYVRAAEAIEEHRNYLHHDELRVRFLEGKESVYESLVQMSLEQNADVTAWQWCERGKSRALADLLSRHLPSVRAEADPALLGQVNRLREELNSQYVRSRSDGGDFAVAVPREQIQRTEKALEQSLRQLSDIDTQFGSLFGAAPGSLEDVRQALPKHTTLVEYYVARGEVMAFVLDSTTLRVYRRLAPIEAIQQLRQGLDFQMQKFALSEDYVARHQDQMLNATMAYLAWLYTHLVAPWIQDVSTSSLIIVPHGELHALPLHAVYDGKNHLIDRFRICYAPSAEIFCRSTAGQRPQAGEGLLVGRADELAPGIEDEIRHLQALMPESRALLGAEASRSALFEHAGAARFIHISAHSFFRKDNPIFSGFHLADGPVTALDLYSQAWNAELVTLSGCSSGLSEVTGGDELIGLVRGFLYAGTSALLMSLWNVSDDATVCLTEAFYRHWLADGDKSRALAAAMQEVRVQYNHPFYWAPFILVGSP